MSDLELEPVAPKAPEPEPVVAPPPPQREADVPQLEP